MFLLSGSGPNEYPSSTAYRVDWGADRDTQKNNLPFVLKVVQMEKPGDCQSNYKRKCQSFALVLVLVYSYWWGLRVFCENFPYAEGAEVGLLQDLYALRGHCPLNDRNWLLWASFQQVSGWLLYSGSHIQTLGRFHWHRFKISQDLTDDQ